MFQCDVILMYVSYVALLKPCIRIKRSFILWNNDLLGLKEAKYSSRYIPVATYGWRYRINHKVVFREI